MKGRRDGRCKVSNFWINRCNQPGLASKISPGRPLSTLLTMWMRTTVINAIANQVRFPNNPLLELSRGIWLLYTLPNPTNHAKFVVLNSVDLLIRFGIC